MNNYVNEFLKNKKFVRTIELAVIFLIFIVSVIVRIPNLNRHLSDHHEWLTAHTLVELQIWYEDGALKNKFTHILNFPNDADKFINNATMSPKANAGDEDGNYYYLSHPVLAIVIPYIFFRILSIYPDVLGLQIFNLICHLLCAIFVYLLVDLVVSRKSRINFPAIMGAGLYLILPENLWFHSNVYFVEIFVQLPFIISLYLVIMYFKHPKLSIGSKNILLSLIGLAIFCTIYTEWIGVFLSLSLLVYCLINIKKSRDYIKIFLVVSISTFVAIAIFILQNSSIVGFKNVISYLLDTFVFRAGISEDGKGFTNVKNIYWWYLVGYFPAFIIIAFLLILFLLNIRKVGFKKFVEKYGLALYLSFLPVVMHNMIFKNFTSIHDFSVLKASIFFTMFISFILGALMELGVFSDKLRVVSFLILVILMLQVSINIYKNNFAYSPNPDKYYNVAKVINEKAKSDEVIFFVADVTTRPQLNFYTHRNIVYVESLDEAKNWLISSRSKMNKGIIFISISKNKIERFSVNK